MFIGDVVRRSSSEHISRRCIVVRRFCSEDPTLGWARAHPEQAELCLLPPKWDASTCDPSYQSKLTESLEGYLSWRKWPNVWPGGHGKRTDEILKDKTLRLTSHVLSAPLTLAHFLAQAKLPSNTRVGCVGARAEATIPVDLWKEFLLYRSSMTTTDTVSEYSIDFVGPEIVAFSQGKTPDRKVTLENGYSLVMRWRYRGFLHDLLSSDDTQASKWDTLVFYNPGFGHPHLKGDWKPTLDSILPLSYPMLLTAHSEMDAQRDMEVLRNDFGLDVEYQENPFASRITYRDPFDKDHFVRPNHYVAHLHMQGPD